MFLLFSFLDFVFLCGTPLHKAVQKSPPANNLCVSVCVPVCICRMVPESLVWFWQQLKEGGSVTSSCDRSQTALTAWHVWWREAVLQPNRCYSAIFFDHNMAAYELLRRQVCCFHYRGGLFQISSDCRWDWGGRLHYVGTRCLLRASARHNNFPLPNDPIPLGMFMLNVVLTKATLLGNVGGNSWLFFFTFRLFSISPLSHQGPDLWNFNFKKGKLFIQEWLGFFFFTF